MFSPDGVKGRPPNVKLTTRTTAPYTGGRTLHCLSGSFDGHAENKLYGTCSDITGAGLGELVSRFGRKKVSPGGCLAYACGLYRRLEDWTMLTVMMTPFDG